MRSGAGAFMIIGEQKSGTTLLYDLLKTNRLVRPPPGDRKEQHMFDHNHYLTPCRLSDYLRGLRTVGGAVGATSVTGEATPDYLADPIAAHAIAALLPRLRVIVLTRDPVRRAHAAWDQSRRAGSEGRAFDEAVENELPTAQRCAALARALARGHGVNATRDGYRRAATPLLGAGANAADEEYASRCGHFIEGRPQNCWVNRKYEQFPACKRYLQKGFFGWHLELWAALFPPQQLLVLRAESLFSDQGRVLAAAEDFLGIRDGARGASGGGGGGPKPKECWHDCKVAKAKFSLSPRLEQRLRDLYRDSDALVTEITTRLGIRYVP